MWITEGRHGAGAETGWEDKRPTLDLTGINVGSTRIAPWPFVSIASDTVASRLQHKYPPRPLTSSSGPVPHGPRPRAQKPQCPMRSTPMLTRAATAALMARRKIQKQIRQVEVRNNRGHKSVSFRCRDLFCLTHSGGLSLSGIVVAMGTSNRIVLPKTSSGPMFRRTNNHTRRL